MVYTFYTTYKNGVFFGDVFFYLTHMKMRICILDLEVDSLSWLA
jgi:hypothetical protein